MDGLLQVIWALRARRARARPSCARRYPWSTDKDGIIAALLSAEITATHGERSRRNLRGLAQDLVPFYERIDAHATSEQRRCWRKCRERKHPASELAGEKIQTILTTRRGTANRSAESSHRGNGWFAARPSGTEDIYKIYAESFRGEQHLQQIEADAQTIVGQALTSAVSAD